jgi:hypothetical protein
MRIGSPQSTTTLLESCAADASTASASCHDTANDDQLEVIAAIWEVFQPSGEWPVVDSIDRLIDESWSLDIYANIAVLARKPRAVRSIGAREDAAVRLRVRAIDMCENSEDDLALFIRMVRWLAERERAFQPSSPHQVEQVRVTSEQLSADLAAEAGMLTPSRYGSCGCWLMSSIFRGEAASTSTATGALGDEPAP